MPAQRSVRGEPLERLERLIGKDPSEILDRIHSGDPLGLADMCRHVLRAEAMIVDPVRLLEKTLVEVAYELYLARKEHPDAHCLEQCTAKALERLLNQDVKAELSQPALPQNDELFRFISEAFGVPLGDGRRATVDFCALPGRTRRAFFALLVDKKPLQACIEEGIGTRETLRDDLWKALRALGHLSAAEVAKCRRRAQPNSRGVPCLAPRIGSILEEVATNPHSEIMRTSTRHLSDVLNIGEPLSARNSSLTSTEKHLIELHREELSHLLLDASKRLMQSLEIERTRIIWETPALEMSRWRHRVGKVLENATLLGVEDDTERLVALVRGAQPAPKASELAAASLRLVPSNEARIELALCLNCEGRPEDALGVLKGILAYPSSARHRSMALANCGFVTAQLGRLGEAEQWYRSASTEGEPRAYCFISWFALALSSGNWKEALQAAELLERHCPRDDPEVSRCIRSLEADASAGDWECWFPSRDKDKYFRRIKDKLPPLARTIAQIVA